MNLKLIFAASLLATFVAWYLCSLIPGRTPRGILRAIIIALLCSPGIIIGHGFAVVPSLFALYVQPSIFTLGPMLVVLVIALGIIFGVPALRNHSSSWPPSAEDIFLKAYVPKFVFFGIVSAVLMLALIYTDQQRAMWVIALKYGLFFAGALINLTLCCWATRVKQARPLLTPLFFCCSVAACDRTHRALYVVWGRCYRWTYRKRATTVCGLRLPGRFRAPVC